MSDDEVDYELLDLLRQRLGINKPSDGIPSDTGVLKDAEYIYNNAVDVSIDMWSTKSAALMIHKTIQERGYSMAAWSEHELHPRLGTDLDEVEMANFVFTMDLLNFSFWSELTEQDRFQVEYKGKRHTGYMTLVASLQRALEEGIPITTPRYWRSISFTDDIVKHVFRSATAEEIALLEERILVLREAGEVLKEFDDQSDALDEAESSRASTSAVEQSNKIASEQGEAASGQEPATSIDTSADLSAAASPTILDAERHGDGTTASSTDDAAVPQTLDHDWIKVDEPMQVHEPAAEEEKTAAPSSHPLFVSKTDTSVRALIQKAHGSAGTLVNLLAKHFSSFRDECRYDGRKVRLLKRAQIFVADLNAACSNTGLGRFSDMDHLTMFADYRVPQILHRLGVLAYSPPLSSHIVRKLPLEHRGSWEVQIRGCSIWATELLRREISRQPGGESVNAVLIDFLLYDLAKEQEFSKDSVPHHRTRSINY